MVTSEGIIANPKKTKILADLQSPRTLKEMQSLVRKLAALNSIQRGGEYNITFEPRNAVKGQVLADFIIETLDGESPEKYFWAPKITPERDETEKWMLFTDGASSSKGSRVGLVLIGPSGVDHTYALRLTFDNSNNEVEYEALLAGLRIAKRMNIQKLEAKVDSKLVASKINGERGKHYSRRGRRQLDDPDHPMPGEGIWPKDKNEARNLRVKIGQYAMENKWGMDILGPLPQAPETVKYVIVAIDYFTKWIEAKPLARITGLNEEDIRLNQDLLTERRELAAIREAKYKIKLEQYYNKKVHLTSFKPGEFVFRKNEASKVEDQGKLGPK
ncbi:reverse transcriptase domain-containing protein [Tanacetum coccineum]